ncbi:rhomboid family protein [Coprobacter tertius]|uniref:Rhomboid family intramembrane serine protease n=1 Tax=Coprobacter tertius TaxID=2944915 RepID=A0ABT1MII5_9BACT|nr:rhomboid family intramembrane serine protease [Coprobacter tertius]MCP9612420.1 rhomboid family intramembrane serine protease [Coprobacter tertius]
MAAIFDNLKMQYKSGSLLIKLIFINVALFLVLKLAVVLLLLFRIDGSIIYDYLQLPSNPVELLHRPWTLITYMFLHKDFWHILFNMLWFYWFGQIFLSYFSEKQMGALYFLGGISGAILYLLAYNFLPYFSGIDARLMGASASVLAIVLATAVYVPDFKVNLLFLGAISLKYIAIITVLIDIFSITSSNAGGHIAHLGGALLGIIFALQWKKGKDITRFINICIDKIVTVFKGRTARPKMKIKYKRAETDMEYNARKNAEMEEIDRILDKIKKSGYSALSSDEKKKLFDAGKK